MEVHQASTEGKKEREEMLIGSKEKKWAKKLITNSKKTLKIKMTKIRIKMKKTKIKIKNRKIRIKIKDHHQKRKKKWLKKFDDKEIKIFIKNIIICILENLPLFFAYFCSVLQ
jgi:hypothetical protein